MEGNGGKTRRNLHVITDLTKEEIVLILNNAKLIKAHPEIYNKKLKRKNVLMLFEKPSLRTRISLESGMSQMGAHAIYYPLADGPLGKGKENIHDTAKTVSRYVDIIAARLNSRNDFSELSRCSSIPTLNLLDDYGHPCQILADFQTIAERKDITNKLKLAYFGDAHNNVTYDLLRMCAILGFHMDIACPNEDTFKPEEAVMTQVYHIAETTGSCIRVLDNVAKVAEAADIVYTDTWMSYGIKPHESETRFSVLKPFQVTPTTMKSAKPDAIFMHCLPATRGNEMTEEVIDGAQSVVFDQAENRLHVQKAIILFLLHKESL